MNSTFLFSLVVVASAVATQPARGQDKGEGRTVDEKAIRAVLATCEETWNKHDMKAWGKLFTDDVDYVNRAGGLWKGNRANVEAHEAIHEAMKKQNQKMTWTAAVEKISFLSPDIALVHATSNWPGFTFPSGEEAKEFRGIMTLVMVKQDGNWLIRALHNTLVNATSTPKQPNKNN
jgi:uncharacterized protein (TIGR02246 family)